MVYFATSKNSYVKSTMYLHRNIHKYTCIYPNRKTCNHIGRKEMAFKYILCMIFQGTDCDADHRPSVANVREILAEIKEAAH